MSDCMPPSLADLLEQVVELSRRELIAHFC